MNDPDEFIVENDDSRPLACGELTGWETVLFEVADEEDPLD